MNYNAGDTPEIRVPGNLDDAREIQGDLSVKISLEPLSRRISLIAGADAAYSTKNVYGSAVLVDFPALRRIDSALMVEPVKFPYISGFLAFREDPALLRAIRNLKCEPDLVIFNGHGYAHPMRVGLASHLGVLLDIPTFGVAERPMIGQADIPGLERGSISLLLDADEVIGMMVRTRNNKKPLCVSAGHRIDLEESVRITLSTTTRHRMPEPLRQVHMLSSSSVRSDTGDTYLYS
jgi:deoxyribonuclease V